MANNYTQATLTPDVKLNDELRALLRLQGAGIEKGDEEGTEYVFFEEYVNEVIELEYASEEELSKQQAGAWEGKTIADILRAVLDLNPEVELLTLEAGYTCSKMRPGEFGGFGLYVTREQFCWISTSNVHLIDGKLVSQVKVEEFAA